MTFNDLVEKTKSFEGFRERAYDDLQPNKTITNISQVKGTLTIGYGRITNVCVGEITTQANEHQYLYTKLYSVMMGVKSRLDMWGYAYNDNILYALTDFVYNLGFGNLSTLTSSGQRDITTVGEKILLYNKAGGKVLAGLTKRRQWEHDLFFDTLAENTIVKNKEVKDIQQYLNNKYNAGLKVDNKFGNKTYNAIIDNLK